MSTAVDIPARPSCGVSEQVSSQTADSAEAAAANVESKHALIARACEENDIDNLIRLATSEGGLLNDELRRKACEYKVYTSSCLQDLMVCIGPMLIGSEAGPEKSETNQSALWTDLPPHRDEDQVQLDVNRAFVYYPNGEFKTTAQ
jgi:TBC1 domain family member 20